MGPEESLKALKDRLLERVPKDGVGCFPCARILEDLGANGRLTQHPGSWIDGSPVFPVSGKVAHLKLEGFWEPGLGALAGEGAKA